MVQAFTIGGQVAIVMAGGPAFQTEPLTAAQWGWTLLFGLLTFPVGALLRLIPDKLVIGFASRYLKPLAWPLIKTVRWFRQRKLVKTLEREVKEATEATAAAERARRASTAQVDNDDDDDEQDEERRVRRMRWRRGKHYRDRIQALQQQIEKHRAPTNTPAAETTTSTTAAPILPPGVVSGTRTSTDAATTATVESNGQVSHTSSLLERLPGRLVRGNGKAAEEREGGGGFYVHPDTPASDPVLVVMRGGGSAARTCPPSQDPELLGYMGFYKRK